MNGQHAARGLLSRRRFVQGASLAGLGLLAGCGGLLGQIRPQPSPVHGMGYLSLNADTPDVIDLGPSDGLAVGHDRERLELSTRQADWPERQEIADVVERECSGNEVCAA